MNKSILAALMISSFVLTGCNELADVVDSNDEVLKTAKPATAADVGNPIVSFNPISGLGDVVISTPNDLILDTDSTSSTYLRLQKAYNVTADVYVATSQLDGWGIGQSFTIKVSLPDTDKYQTSLDASTVQQAGAVYLFKCSSGSIIASSCASPSSLTYGVDFSTSVSDDGIVVTPLKPFASNTGYFLGVTDIVKDNLGQSLVRSAVFNTYSTSTGNGSSAEVSLNTLLSGTNSTIATLSSIGVNNIVYSATFTTQSVEPVAQAVLDDIKSKATLTNIASAGYTLRTALTSFGVTYADGSDTANLLDNVDIYTATLNLPYYLPYPGLNGVNSTTCAYSTLCGNWLNSSNQSPWKGGATPIVSTDIIGTPGVVNVLMAIPNAALLNGSDLKIVQFIHGITSVKESGLLIAPALAKAKFATIMIDHPLHGSRSFDADNDTVYDVTATASSNGAAYAKGNAAVFGNLQSLLTARDNLRQAASDQLSLKYALANTDLTSINGLATDTLTSLVGVSLGSIISTQVIGMSEIYDDKGSDNSYEYQAAALTVGGTQVAPIMGYSNSFGSIVKTALTGTTGFSGGVASAVGYTTNQAVTLQAAAGYSAAQTAVSLNALQAQTALGISAQQATNEFNAIITLAYPSFLKTFVTGAQTVVDAGDSLVWASKTTTTPILATQIVGNGVNLSDQTVPNNITNNGFPLGGTQALLSALNLTKASSTTTGSDLRVYTNFLVGKHTSALDPSEASGVTVGQAAAATTEMQTQIATFLATGGANLPVTDTSGTIVE